MQLIRLTKYTWRKPTSCILIQLRLKEQFQILLLGIADIADGLISVLSLGFLSGEFGPWLLFYVFEDAPDVSSDIMEKALGGQHHG